MGEKEKAFTVTLKCNWDNDGKNSKIANLIGTYTVWNNSFECKWTGENYSLDGYHALPSNVSRYFDNYLYIFDALLNTLFGDPVVDLAYTQYKA